MKHFHDFAPLREVIPDCTALARSYHRCDHSCSVIFRVFPEKKQHFNLVLFLRSSANSGFYEAADCQSTREQIIHRPAPKRRFMKSLTGQSSLSRSWHLHREGLLYDAGLTMARTNVDDSWFADPKERRSALIQAMRDAPINYEWMADGAALKAWRLAQRYWKEGEELIPEDVWRRANLEILVECDLAERRSSGIYVRGTKEQHAWILQRTEAGKKRGHATRNPDGTFTSGGPADSQRPSSGAGGSLDKSPATVQRTASGTPPLIQPPALAPALALAPAQVTSSSSNNSSGNPQGDRQQPVDNDTGDDPPPPESPYYSDTADGPPGKRSLKFEKIHMQLARWMLKKVALHGVAAERLHQADERVWANELRLVIQDGVPLTLLMDLLQWVYDDAFWKHRIESPAGLRRNLKGLLEKYREHKEMLQNH